jgi:hypothetical protein
MSNLSVNALPMPKKHKPLDILRYHLVEEEVVAQGPHSTMVGNTTSNGHRTFSPAVGGSSVATPLSLYQASFRGRHAAPSPDLLDDAMPQANETQTSTTQRNNKKVAIKSRALNSNPRHAVTTRHQTLSELLEVDRRAVESCTPQFKAKHLRHTAPLPTPSLLPQSATSPPVTTSPTSPLVMLGDAENDSAAVTSSTYRESFAQSKRLATAAAAGKMLPRDPVDTTKKPLTETSLSRASFPRYDAMVYEQRNKQVIKAHDAVARRLADATAYARRQPATGSTESQTLQSLHQASFVAPSAALVPPPRRNPELIQAAASLRERECAGYFNMAVTSTQRGDYSVAAQIKKSSVRQPVPVASGGEALGRPSSVASCAPMRYVAGRAASSMAAIAVVEQFPPSVLSRALDDMSTELADPPAYRCQSSCEIIHQRNALFPGATYHTPVAQRTGPDVINRRCAVDAEHKHRAAGISLRPCDAPRPTMHTCSEIFGSQPAVTGLSLSQASYRPFKFTS